MDPKFVGQVCRPAGLCPEPIEPFFDRLEFGSVRLELGSTVQAWVAGIFTVMQGVWALTNRGHVRLLSVFGFRLDRVLVQVGGMDAGTKPSPQSTLQS